MKVLHQIHDTSIGGVEAAAAHLRHRLAGPHGGSGTGHSPTASGTRTDGDEAAAGIRYRVAAFEDAPQQERALSADVIGHGLNRPSSVLRLARTVVRTDPDVLVTSLWRSLLVAMTARALGWRGTWAVWVHLTNYSHRVDALLHRLALPRADLVMCDSVAVRDQLVAPQLRATGADVPLALVRPDAVPLAARASGPPSPEEPLRLVFWGRMAAAKRLDRVVELLAQLHRIRPGGARLTLVGPDGGDLARIRAAIDAHSVADLVELRGPAGRADIAEHVAAAHAFVQLSDFEGFAMSAHEALGSGMVCVLTPVGDLAVDTEDGVHALHHHGDAARTAERLAALAEDPAAWARMSQAARRSGTGHMLEEFSAACHQAVGAR